MGKIDANKKKHFRILITIMIILFIPVISTLLYSFTSSWGSKILPDGFSFKWYRILFSDERFVNALGRSLIVSSLSLVISIIVILPSILSIYYYFPKHLKYFELLTILPFTIPGIAMAVGLLKIYSNGPVVLTGTIWILVGAYFMVTLPFIYRGIRNNLEGLNVRELIEAANVLGATDMMAFTKIVIPNLKKGIISAVLLSFSFLLGEFLFANYLAGLGFETIQVYLVSMKGKSGHFTSAIVITFFTFLLFITLVAFKINLIFIKTRKGRK